MAEGRIYVPVSGNTANGITTMSNSGGIEGDSYWLFWDVGGYTNLEWFWHDSNNHIKTGWANYLAKYPDLNYTNDETGFRQYLTEMKPSNLDEILGDWDIWSKMEFVLEHHEVFEKAGCVTTV